MSPTSTVSRSSLQGEANANPLLPSAPTLFPKIADHRSSERIKRASKLDSLRPWQFPACASRGYLPLRGCTISLPAIVFTWKLCFHLLLHPRVASPPLPCRVPCPSGRDGGTRGEGWQLHGGFPRPGAVEAALVSPPSDGDGDDEEEEEGDSGQAPEEADGDDRGPANEVRGGYRSRRRDDEWVDWEDQILEDTVPLVSFVRMLLHSGKYESGDRLSPEHEKTIMERLLPYHPEFEKKIGCGIDFITIGYHPDFENSRCLFIVRKDGELIDFSYWKCIEGLIRKKYPLYADSFILRHFRRRRHND